MVFRESIAHTYSLSYSHHSHQHTLADASITPAGVSSLIGDGGAQNAIIHMITNSTHNHHTFRPSAAGWCSLHIHPLLARAHRSLVPARPHSPILCLQTSGLACRLCLFRHHLRSRWRSRRTAQPKVRCSLRACSSSLFCVCASHTCSVSRIHRRSATLSQSDFLANSSFSDQSQRQKVRFHALPRAS